MLDVDVYHRLLRGAVKFNEELEANQLNRIVGTSVGLAQSITKYSREVKGEKIQLLGSRLLLFYRGIAFMLIGIAVALFIEKNWL